MDERLLLFLSCLVWAFHAPASSCIALLLLFLISIRLELFLLHLYLNINLQLNRRLLNVNFRRRWASVLVLAGFVLWGLWFFPQPTEQSYLYIVNHVLLLHTHHALIHSHENAIPSANDYVENNIEREKPRCHGTLGVEKKSWRCNRRHCIAKYIHTNSTNVKLIENQSWKTCRKNKQNSLRPQRLMQKMRLSRPTPFCLVRNTQCTLTPSRYTNVSGK